VPRDEATDALVALRRIVRTLRLADREAEIACGLSAAQLFVLETLAEAPHISQGDLAARTLTDQSSVSTVVAKLVKRGLVSRAVSKSDRRRTELALTTSGKQMLARAPTMPQVAMIAAIRALPPAKRAELVRALEGLATVIGAGELAPRMFFEDEPRRPTKKR
jgi:DNA-binding MarR family transcriptional regulator